MRLGTVGALCCNSKAAEKPKRMRARIGLIDVETRSYEADIFDVLQGFWRWR